MRRAIALVLLLSVPAAAQEAGWNRQDVVIFVPAPPQPKLVRRPMTSLWAAGAGLFLGAWLTNIAGTAIGAREDVGTAAIPFAGPWIQYGFQYSSSTSQALAQALLATDGIIQVAGGAMLVVGLSIWRTERRYAARPRWIASPWLGRSGAGLTLSAGW